MAKKNNIWIKIIGIMLTVLSLLWATGGKLLLDRISNIEKEMSLARQHTMANAISTAEINVKTQNIEKQLEKIEKKLER